MSDDWLLFQPHETALHENLSHKLVRLLEDLFPESVHVRDVGLKASDDLEVWKYAQDNSLIFALRIQTFTSAVFSWDSLRKYCGYDWVIALRRTSKRY